VEEPPAPEPPLEEPPVDDPPLPFPPLLLPPLVLPLESPPLPPLLLPPLPLPPPWPPESLPPDAAEPPSSASEAVNSSPEQPGAAQASTTKRESAPDERVIGLHKRTPLALDVQKGSALARREDVDFSVAREVAGDEVTARPAVVVDEVGDEGRGTAVTL
jgi:hypothetical protein